MPRMAACFLLAAGLHGGVLFGLGLSLSEPPAYGVRAGQNSLEVELVAAPAAPTAPSVDPVPDTAPAEVPVPEPEPEKPHEPAAAEEPDDLATLASVTRPDPAPARAPRPALSTPRPEPAREKGDGTAQSSPQWKVSLALVPDLL